MTPALVLAHHPAPESGGGIVVAALVLAIVMIVALWLAFAAHRGLGARGGNPDARTEGDQHRLG